MHPISETYRSAAAASDAGGPAHDGPAAARPPQPPRATFAPTYGRDPRYKLPILAGLLSCVPGLGQVYLGLYVRGFVNAIVIAALISFLANVRSDELIPLASLFMIFYWLFNVIDAIRQATLYNQALEGGRLDEPEVYSPLRGSIWGGVTLMTVGAILLSHTLFGFTLRWLEDWWPVVLIAFGLILFGRAVQEGLTRDRDRR
jgi:hypothetical protein